jgi:hypothetical protein
MTVSVGVAGADSETALLSVLEQPAMVITSAALSASDNVDFISIFPFFLCQRATGNFTLIVVLMLPSGWFLLTAAALAECGSWPREMDGFKLFSV